MLTSSRPIFDVREGDIYLTHRKKGIARALIEFLSRWLVVEALCVTIVNNI